MSQSNNNKPKPNKDNKSLVVRWANDKGAFSIVKKSKKR